MHEIAPPLTPPVRTLMGPGPSDIHPRVLQALALPTIGHLDPYYLETMDRLQGMLRQVFKTKNQMTMAISGTGSAGMEACVHNLIEPGEGFLACVNGVFGGRMAEEARRAGAEVATIECPWGQVFSVAEIEEALHKHKPKVVGIVMAETSTGARQPLQEIADVVHDAGALLLVDAVTALGGILVEVDQWGIDAIYSGTQKCLSCPPGLAPISLNERAMEKIHARTTPCRSWYLDVSLLSNYWGSDRTYHHTAPINMTFALYEALRLILEEGLEGCFSRHQRHHQALKAGLTALGLKYAAQENFQLPMLNAVLIPEGLDDATIRGGLLKDFGIEIGGGLGVFKGKAWRIGLMGYAARAENVLKFLAALEQLLLRNGHSCSPGCSIAAANEVYSGCGV
ncbi:Alanine-glyoxylate aminotransferase apoenzyme [Planctomycetales bacterium 10988]|nr:Alanine-glyoxylate aminotransferase apoenzyme [Planctomycetales bacterium 10988]